MKGASCLWGWRKRKEASLFCSCRGEKFQFWKLEVQDQGASRFGVRTCEIIRSGEDNAHTRLNNWPQRDGTWAPTPCRPCRDRPRRVAAAPCRPADPEPLPSTSSVGPSHSGPPPSSPQGQRRHHTGVLIKLLAADGKPPSSARRWRWAFWGPGMCRDGIAGDAASQPADASAASLEPRGGPGTRSPQKAPPPNASLS